MKRKIEYWIFDAYKMPSEYLALCRIAYALFNLFFLFHFDFSWVSEYPDAFYRQKPGLAFFFDGFPPKWFFFILNTGLGILTLLLLVGYRTKWMSILNTLFLIVGFSFVFAFGTTYHLVMWVLFPAVMAFSNWGAAISLDAIRNEGKGEAEFWPISLMSLLIGFSFFTSGFSKWWGGWLKWDASASWQYFHIVRDKVGRRLYLSDFTASIQHPVFWELLDWLVVGLEIGILVAVLHPRAFRWFLGFATLFHFANMLILNISFSIHLVIFLVFVDWRNTRFIKNKHLNRLVFHLDAFIKKQNAWTVSAMILVYLCLFFGLAEHSRVDKLSWIEYLVYPLGVFATASFMYHEIKGWLIQHNNPK